MASRAQSVGQVFFSAFVLKFFKQHVCILLKFLKTSTGKYQPRAGQIYCMDWRDRGCDSVGLATVHEQGHSPP